MKVLVACEFSGIVRDAFIAKGHDAISCDFLPTVSSGPHIIADVIDVLTTPAYSFDMLIAFPPCTHLSCSGARWFKKKQKTGEQERAMLFFLQLIYSYPEKVAVENPVGIMSTKHRKPDQIIQPWQFGHGETKATCLWLKGLPLLQPTNIVEGRESRIHKMAPSKDRGKLRSITYQGIADAMAEQWG